MSETTKKLDRILTPGGGAIPPATSLNLIGMVRECKKSANLEFALDNTGRWVEIPKALVESVEQIGILELGGTSYAVADLVIRRPEGDTTWFDLLEFALRRVGVVCDQLADANNNGECKCGKPTAGVVLRMRRLGSGNTGKCFLCWIFTVGSGADFCYHAGACG